MLAIYDDTSQKREIIEEIIGEKKFAEVVVNGQTLFQKFTDDISKIYRVSTSINISSTDKVLIMV